MKKDGSKLALIGEMWGKKYSPHKLANFVIKKIDSDKTYDLAIAHSICEENAEHLRKILYEKCPNIKSISILELGCALGSHSGPGTLAVGVQEHLSTK